MNKPEAEAMIQRQRWRWGSDDSDEAIARRGERAFRAAGIAFTIGSAAEGFIAAWFSKPVFFITAGGFLVGAAVLE